MKNYKNDAELDKLFTDVIKDRPDLSGIRIKCLLVDTKSKWSGKVIKCSSLVKYFTGYDVLIFVNNNFWVSETDVSKRKALLAHELSHVTIRKGNVKLVPHDIEEFISVVAKYGEWTPELEHLKNVLSEKKKK